MSVINRLIYLTDFELIKDQICNLQIGQLLIALNAFLVKLGRRIVGKNLHVLEQY